MLITQDRSFKLSLPPTQGRSAGIHLSDILRDLDTLFRKPEEGDDLGVDPQYSLRGFAWERVLSQSFGETHESDKLISQIELYEDIPGVGRVYMTLDGWVFVDSSRLREYKATEKSSSRLDSDKLTPQALVESWKTNFRTWDWQVQCYMRKLGVLECELYVWWVRGDYKFTKTALERRDALERRTTRYLLQYQPWEIEETWRMVCNHALTMKSRGRL